MCRVINLGILSSGTEYTVKHAWPEACFLQGGDDGLVFSAKESYHTAFFEAFPRDPNTFLRGEGASIEEAEQKAWEKYQVILNCPGHEFERRGYDSGAGFCKHCNLFMVGVFEPTTECCICGVKTYHDFDRHNKVYCKDHSRDKPLDSWTESDWLLVDLDYQKREGRYWYEQQQLSISNKMEIA